MHVHGSQEDNLEHQFSYSTIWALDSELRSASGNGIHVEVRGNFRALVFLFHHMGPRL